MTLTHTQRGQALIEATLYKNHPWFARGIIDFDTIKIKEGITRFMNHLVIIDFEEKNIHIDGYRQRMKKEVFQDLMDIVRLKLTKKLKHVQ